MSEEIAHLYFPTILPDRIIVELLVTSVLTIPFTLWMYVIKPTHGTLVDFLHSQTFHYIQASCHRKCTPPYDRVDTVVYPLGYVPRRGHHHHS